MTPYQAPEATGSPESLDNQVPSSKPKVFGIIHIIYSVLGGLRSLVMISIFFLFPAFVGKMQEAADEEGLDLEALRQVWDILDDWIIIEGVICLVLSIVLLVAGIGLLKRKAWSRVTSIAWAVSRILLTIAGLIYMLPKTQQIQEMAESMEGQPMPGSSGMGQTLSDIPSIIMVIAYPVVTLIFMFGADMKNALKR